MGTVKLASMIMPAVLLMVFVAAKFYQENDGAFETVVSRIVPWPTTAIKGQIGKLEYSASASALTPLQAEDSTDLSETASMSTDNKEESVERDGTLAVPSLLPRNRLKLVDIASALFKSAESLTLQEPTPDSVNSSAEDVKIATTELPNIFKVPELFLTTTTDAAVAAPLDEISPANFVEVKMRVNDTDLIFEPKGNWERNSNGQGFSFMGSPHGEEDAPEILNFNTSLAHQMLNGKWVYFWGDSTMRQIFTAFLNGIQGSSISFQEAKSTFRSSGAQPNRKPYKPLPFDDTPCSVNEHAEHEDLVTQGSGASVSLTYGWKHFIHEEYDVTFLHEVLPSLRPGALPDVIVLSTGVHNCWHFGDSREWENMRELDAFLAELDRTEFPLPKIVWLDNVLFINGPPNSGWPDVCRRFNEYLRKRVKERVLGGNRREAFVSREHMTWDTPAELWGDVWRLHLAGDVYVAVGGLVLQAMKALGV
ncbi:hypothetical protein KFL_000230340 [Klebsormidium nitens]|uniref:Uncharacterized protein n=1 Tax=Klebsormidium nitens TaxID=105231 RepID=A0A1Y1HKE6_KLENI|nr:hypothetical protein KFL_000230340 [Klebsormidium nitens]|eukprot:GAQ79055.1 hypothetical protein KFL_000230340 [Klebsormidium nitens]